MSVLSGSDTPRRRRREEGMALLMTLWVLTAVAAMVTPLAVGARQEHLRDLRTVEDVTLRAAVDAAFARALAEIAAGTVALGEEQRWRWGEVALRYLVTGESGRVDLNAASPETLDALFAAQGMSEADAEALRGRILARRRRAEEAGGSTEPPEAGAGPLVHPSELRALLGEGRADDASLYAKLLPDITVWTAASRPAAALARPALRARLGEPASVPAEAEDLPDGGSEPDPAGVYRLDIRAELPGGGARRTLVVVARTAAGWRVREWMSPLAVGEVDDE